MTMEDAFIGIVERGRNHSENGAASRPDATREPRP
jgi:hypothetical protein